MGLMPKTVYELCEALRMNPTPDYQKRVFDQLLVKDELEEKMKKYKIGRWKNNGQ